MAALPLNPVILATLGPLSLACLGVVPGFPVGEARVEYRLVEVASDPTRDDVPTMWRLNLRATGLDATAGPVRFVLENWGDWVGAEYPYLEVLHSEPALVDPLPAPNEFLFVEVPGREATYELDLSLRPTRQGSETRARHGLLPFVAPDYAFANGNSVFPRVEQAGQRVEGPRQITFEVPEQRIIVTGWRGIVASGEALALDPADGNALFALGEPAATAAGGGAGARVEVHQFGAGPDVTAAVLDLVGTLAPHMGAALGIPAPSPLIVFVTDAGSGGMGADHGLVVGFAADTPAEFAHSPYFQDLVAHELFHYWLGISIPGEESIPWFHEGFTDYLSRWHRVATGTAPRTWLAERLLELEQDALENSSLGKVAFADTSIDWRDGDGPNEKMVYQGGAVLAFGLDAELRARGEPALHALLRELASEGQRSESLLDRLWRWARERGLAEFWERHLDGTEPPSVEHALGRAGYRIEKRVGELTWLGLGASGRGLGARITALAEDGPGLAAGVRLGDVVSGYAPARADEIEPPAAWHDEYTFGLTLYDPRASEVKLWLDRGGENVELSITPEPREGGSERVIFDSGETLDSFFEILPPREERVDVGDR